MSHLTRVTLAVLIFASVFSSPVFAKDKLKLEVGKLKPSKDRMELTGLPIVSYDSDAGFGFGVIVGVYKKNESVKPYKFAIITQVYLTTTGQNSHYVKTDLVDVNNTPFRVLSKVGFLAVFNENYCGDGMRANCFVKKPTYLTKEQERTYFQYRYFSFYGNVEARYRLKNLPHKVEILARYRGTYYLPGGWGDLAPYSPSLFLNQQDPSFYQGYASVFSVGAMFDDRDDEVSPTRGYWAEVALRGSSKWIGSSWDYVGLNLTARGFVPFDAKRQWILAVQGIVDGMWGEAPLQEIVRIGNSLSGTAFGGSEIGRGIRAQYFPGRLKIIGQLELRYRFIDLELFKQRFGFVALTFADAAITSWKVNDFTTKNLIPKVGFGLGFRVIWNDSFVVRFDLGLSPEENYSPRIYLKLDHVF